MSGSGGDRGYDYQADAYAYILAHGLAGQPMGWFDDIQDIPCRFAMETGGGGDDLRFWTRDGVVFEVQAKHGLRNDETFVDAILRLLRALQDQPSCRGVLLIDRHASQIIREGFRQDVKRFGQGRTDNLSKVFQGVLSAAQKPGLDSPSLYQRLRVVVVDLDEGSDGIAAARALLASVVPHDKTLAAFRLLGKQGHSLTKERGQQDVSEVAEYLQNTTGLSLDNNTPAALWYRYQEWIKKTTADFFCSALKARFPITQAWDQVREFSASTDIASSGQERLARELQRYHEWQRLARDVTGDGRAAEEWVRHSKRTVIVGGPGSGKSTLATRLAYLFASHGDSVFRVRLPVVRGLINAGQTFDGAVSLAATDRSGLPADNVSSLGLPAWLIADGLDECDPGRVDIAGMLKDWSDGHPDCGVCVFTRPVGHTPEFLPGFQHVELLPLDDTSVRDKSREFFGGITPDQDKAQGMWLSFISELGSRGSASTVTLAARNPLLLGFLVRLSADGQKCTGSRSSLCGKIIDRVYKTDPIGREVINVDRAVAMTAVAAIGVSVLDQPTRAVDDVCSDVSRSLGGGLDAARLAEQALAFWEQRGLVERVTTGSLDALTFLHPTLGEYAAGLHIARLDPSDLTLLIRAKRHSPRWREPILHAASMGVGDAVVRSLLAVDNPDDPASEEAMLAAAAAQDSAISTQLLPELIHHLHARMVSSIPLVAADAATALAGLAATAPAQVAESVAVLLMHEQSWTRALAFAVAMDAGAKYITTDQVRQWVEAYPAVRTEVLWEHGRPLLADEASDLRHKSLLLAVRRLLGELPPEEAKEDLQRLLQDGHISARDHEQVAIIASAAGHQDWVDEADVWGRRMQEHIDAMVADRKRKVEVDKFFLRCVVSATRVQPSDLGQEPGGFPVVSRLVEGLGIWDMPAYEWNFLLKGDSGDAISEVIRGSLAAMEIDLDSIAAEASFLAKRLSPDADTLYSLLKRTVVKPDWSLAETADLDWSRVVVAVYLPCQAVSLNAARLMEGCGKLKELAGDIEQVLYEGTGVSLYIVGQLAPEVWGTEAFETLRARLTGAPLCIGCERLLKALVTSATTEQMPSALACLIDCMKTDDSEIAASAAEQLASIAEPALAQRVAELGQIFADWDRRGSWCRRCRQFVTGGSCPDCSVVPADPRSGIVKALVRVHGESMEWLVKLLHHCRHDVVETAAASLAKMASESHDVFERLVQELGHGTIPVRGLDEILKLPHEVLLRESLLLLSLLRSDKDVIRARIVSSLSSGWLTRKRAVSLAEEATKDPSEKVRNSAVRACRILSQG